jgi:hypothetical protein
MNELFLEIVGRDGSLGYLTQRHDRIFVVVAINRNLSPR